MKASFYECFLGHTMPAPRDLQSLSILGREGTTDRKIKARNPASKVLSVIPINQNILATLEKVLQQRVQQTIDPANIGSESLCIKEFHTIKEGAAEGRDPCWTI